MATLRDLTDRSERDAPAGWTYNPSAWPDRLPIVALATVGTLIATYLTLYQVDVMTTVGEPFVGRGSERVLNSSVSRLLPVPEIAAGDVHRTAGPFAASFGVIAMWEATRDVRLANIFIVLVLVAAPVVAGHSPGAVLVGLTAGVALAAVTPFGGRVSDRRGEGWRSVLASAKGAGA